MADYGDSGVTGVAGLTKPYTNSSGIYDATTNPTLIQVDNWLDEISALLNMQLGNEYFVTPITAAAVKPGIDNFANRLVTKLIEQDVRNRTSRGPTTRNVSGSSLDLQAEVEQSVNNNARGFESNGAERTSQLVFRGYGRN